MRGEGGLAPSHFYYVCRTLKFNSIALSILVVFLLSCASANRSNLPYNNIKYPPTSWKLPVYIKEGSDRVQLIKKLKYKQTTYYGCYSGTVRLLLSDGSKQDFDVEWRSWIRPERIDLIVNPKQSGKTRSFNVMPKGHSEIYLDDDKTAVRLTYRRALHWCLIENNDGKHSLVGEKPIWKLNPEMDDYPIMYLCYVAARNYYR